jgi:protein O-mannosyl-transferase
LLPSFWARLLPPLLIIALACVAYVNAGHREFLFDSAGNHIVNPRQSQGLVAAVRNYVNGTDTHECAVSYITFAMNYSLNRKLGLDGYDVRSFLVFNVLVHAANACLVYLLLRALLARLDARSTWIPLATAMLFAVHPLQASSVAYIIQRRGSMALMFYLLGVLAYLRARGQHASANGWSYRRILAAIAVPLCWFLSFRSKAIGLTLPVAIMTLEFCLQARDRSRLRKYLLWAGGGVALSMIGMFVAMAVIGWFDWRNFRLHSIDPVAWGPWQQFLTESRAFVHYWKLLWLPLPTWCCIDHDFAVSWSLMEHHAPLAIAFHAAVLCLGVVAALRRYTLLAAGIFWFYVGLIPYILLPEADLLVEYKTYTSSVGVMLIVAEGLRILRGRIALRWQVLGVSALTALLLGTTLSRNHIYHGPLQLWADAAAKSPNKTRPHYNLGNALMNAGRLDEALTQLQTAARLEPANPSVLANVGVAFIKLDRPQDALVPLTESIRLEPRLAEAHANLAAALASLNRLEPAIGEYEEALRLQPQAQNTRYSLALTLAQVGRFDQAIDQLRQMLTYQPNLSVPHRRIGDYLLRSGRVDEAIEAYRSAMAADSKSPELPVLLGAAYATGERWQEAEAAFRQAITLKPNAAEPYVDLGNVLRRQGRTEEAIAAWTQAVSLNPDLSAPHYNLAGVLLELGRQAEAVTHLQEVLRVRPDHAKARALLESLLTTRGS